MTSTPARATAGTVSVTEDHDGLVATILVDRSAKLNALSLEMLAALETQLDTVALSPARVVVLRTGGEKVFCVGADINAFSQFSATDMWRRWIPVGHRVFDRLARLPQPTVAVVDGLAVGGGLELALSCDLRIAAGHARFGLPELGLGTIPGCGWRRAADRPGRRVPREGAHPYPATDRRAYRARVGTGQQRRR